MQFLPFAPELHRRASCGVAAVVFVQGDGDLAVEKKVRNLIRLPVADALVDRLLERPLVLRALALDHHERNPVHETHDVRSPGLVATRPLDFKLRRDVENVVLRVLPVDVTQGETLRLAINRLVEAFSKSQQIIDFFARPHEAFERNIPQCLDALGDALVGEWHLPAFEADLVQALELRCQHVLQHHPAELPLPLNRAFLRAQVGITELLQRAQRGNLADVGFLEGRGHGKKRVECSIRLGLNMDYEGRRAAETEPKI